MAKVRNNSVVQSMPGGEREAPQNKYYLLVSARYMWAKYATVVILAAFLAVMMILHKDDITYANLMYLLRDFNTGDAVYAAGFDPVEYDEQENMTFALFRDELAVMGNRSLRLYNSKGEENRAYEPGYSDPAVASSEKYLLAYDIGTADYSIYTSIAKVNDTEAEGSIECADVNDRGDYLLVCRSDETKYVVCTYDSSFRQIAAYYKNRYVTSAAMGEDGRVIIASFDSAGGGFDCEIELYLDGADSPESSYRTNGVFPVKCGVWEDGGYFVICTDRVLFFAKDGALLKSVESPSAYSSYAVSGSAVALSSDNDAVGGSSAVFVFDTSGNVVYNKTVDGSIASLALSDSAVFALCDGQVTMMPLGEGEILTKETDSGGAVLLVSGESAVLCRKNGAEGLIFGEDPAAPAESVVSSVYGTEPATQDIE